MRKITFFFAGLLITMSALASSELTLNPFYAWGDGMHVKDNEVTCDNDKMWQSAQIWLEQDLSAYDYIWMEMNACQGPFELAIEYDVSGNAATQSVNIESGEYVAYIALDAEKKKNVKKIELKNRENGGSMTIAGIYAGTEAQWQTAMTDFREELDFQYFSEWYRATFKNMVLTMTSDAETQGYGAGSWWKIGDKSDCYKAVVNFATATAKGGNMQITYKREDEEQESTVSKTDFQSGATSVSVNLDETLKDHINQIYIQGAEVGSTYTFKDAYLMKTPTTPMAEREGEGIRNLGQFKGNKDGLDVDGNTIKWNDNQSGKGCDTWLGLSTQDNDYIWFEVEVSGKIQCSVAYPNNIGNADKVITTGTPIVGYKIDKTKTQIDKFCLTNVENGGQLTIKRAFVGSEAEYEAAKAAYLQEMDWTGFKDLWNTIVTGKTATVTIGWGNAGWELSGDHSAYTKVLVEFAEPTPCAGGVTVDYTYTDGDNTYQGFAQNATYVELTMDSRKVSVVRIRVALENSGASYTLKSVALVKDFSAPLALDDTKGDENITALAFRNGATCNVTLNRQFTADNAWYTLCLPFDLNETQITASFGECQIMQLTESYMKGEETLFLQFDEVTTIQAGLPYLFMPSKDINGVSFAGVTINATEPAAYPAGTGQLATMTGTYTCPKLSTDKYVLIADNTLAPSDGESWMLAFRAWFDLNPSVLKVQARCVFGRQTPTELEKAAIATPYTKYMRDGKVYILRNGQKYSLMGQTVK